MRSRLVGLTRYAPAFGTVAPLPLSGATRTTHMALSAVPRRKFWSANVPRLEALNEETAELQRRLRALAPVHVVRGAPDLLGNSGERTQVAQRQVMNHVIKAACGLQHYQAGAWSGYERVRMAHELMMALKAAEELLPVDVAPVSLGKATPLDALSRAIQEGDSLRQLGIAKTLCLGGPSLMGDLPLLKMDEAGHLLYHRTLEELDVARKSSSMDVKKRYVNHVARNVLPLLKNDVAYFQAISFLTSYLHIDFECRLPFTPTTFMLLESQHRLQVRATKELVLKEALMQTGGQYAGVRVRLYEGVQADGRPSGLYVTDSMGTNSDGPNRDVVMKQLHISTGSGADADPRGIAHTAYQDARAHLAKMMLSMPKDAVVVNLGHSLGATVGTRNYLLQKELGFENAYLCGFNGGAFDDEVSRSLVLDAQRRVVLNFAEGDPVPFGGSHVLAGLMRTYQLNPSGGTLATGQWNPVYGKRTDIIHHGTPNELASVLIGLPPSVSVRLEPELRRGFARRFNDLFNFLLPSVRGWVIQKALKPDPIERERTEPQFLSTSFKDPRAKK